MDFEKLGFFYLGKVFNADNQRCTDEYLLYESRDLVTHAVCVGMTGSGKTGLCVGLLEEAAIDGIPAIIIDPKGDLGNLLLTFPGLKPEDFTPWVNEEDARRKELTVEQYAAQQAEFWSKGLAEWGQGPERIARLREAADFSIYTPGSGAGLPVSILRSFSPPPPPAMGDTDLVRERILTTTSGLLGLLGIDADPVRSREHILISNILERSWAAGSDLDLASLIQSVQSPPLTRVGVFDLESFYPAVERAKLAVMLNNLLASPGFSAWMEGAPLEMDQLLYTASGKPRIAIFSIAHLSDTERMFFVTLLLNQLLGWMRSQPGTNSLRALLYMDEVFGFLPPVAEPPSKRAFLTLLKQARAFGLGAVLATQNPVDLDYKGLSNIGTWFIGRLQTDRDKQRLLEGLSSASGVTTGSDQASLSDLLSRLGKRVFLMHNVHESRPVLFQTRWTMSYLRGPLTRLQIKELMDARRQAPSQSRQVATSPPPPAVTPPLPPVKERAAARPLFLQGVEQFYFSRTGGSGSSRTLRPYFFAAARVHVIDNRLGLAHASDLLHVFPAEQAEGGFLWDNAVQLPGGLEDLAPLPSDAEFLEVPNPAVEYFKTGALEKGYRDYLSRSHQLTLWKSNVFKLVSAPGETERDFRIRLSQSAREKRDAALDALRRKYASRFETLQRQEATAQIELKRQEQQYGQQKLNTVLSVGGSLLGALFGGSRGRSGTIGKATTAVRSAGRISSERQDIERAKVKLEEVQQKRASLEAELKLETDRLSASLDPQLEILQELQVRPKKTDILVRSAGLLWMPE